MSTVELSNNSKAYVFDVDGTLTPARMIIEPDHYSMFKEFIETRDVYIVTGSDYPKTDEQMKGLQDLCNESWQCGGAQQWIKGKPGSHVDVQPGKYMLEWFEEKIKESGFNRKTGFHVEVRSGMINFSILGRGASNEQRSRYRAWDNHTKERELLATEFNYIFGVQGFEAMVAGETGLDIFKGGVNKGKLYQHIKPKYDEIVFFGDHCLPGQNDYPFVRLCKSEDTVHHVSGPDETFEIIKDIMNEPI